MSILALGKFPGCFVLLLLWVGSYIPSPHVMSVYDLHLFSSSTDGKLEPQIREQKSYSREAIIRVVSY
jgi:hypothetical protein